MYIYIYISIYIYIYSCSNDILAVVATVQILVR